MTRFITITLAEKEYQIPQAPHKRARAWRESLRDPLQRIISLFQIDFEQIRSTADLLKVVDQAIPALYQAFDDVFTLLIAYSPALESRREELEDNAYDDEIIEAFLLVLRAAVPLDRLRKLLGSESQETSTNSPDPSGETPTLTP